MLVQWIVDEEETERYDIKRVIVVSKLIHVAQYSVRKDVSILP